jgi:group I intron endonuclease
MESNESGVYTIHCQTSGKFYIGSSVKIKARWASHRYLLRNGGHPNTHLQRSYEKYGEHDFVFSIIESCPKNLCVEREQFWISSYSMDSLLNNSPTASTRLGFRHSDETRKLLKLRAKDRNHAHLAEHFFAKGTATFLGKLHTEATKAKMRAIALSRGTPMMAGWNAGIAMPADVRAKVSKTVSEKKVVYGKDRMLDPQKLRQDGLLYKDIALAMGLSMATAHRLASGSRVADKVYAAEKTKGVASK